MSEEVWDVAAGDRAWPACVADLGLMSQPEPVRRLFCVGRREVLEGFEHDRAVTIVGSRRASSYGIRVARDLGRDLAVAGVTVVSGMALGVDAAAHRGALLGGGAPIVVLAGGPDVVYPPMHADLHREIAAAGVIVSEYEPGSAARRHQFLARNRIMAALGKLIVIAEAAQPSGSLVTAGYGLRLGRTVGAVPGRVGARSAEGTNGLLRDGAGVIRGVRDVLDDLLGIERTGAPRAGPAIDPRLESVLALVEGGASTVDELAVAGELDPREGAVSLAHLELLGYVAAGAGGEFERTTLSVPPHDPGRGAGEGHS